MQSLSKVGSGILLCTNSHSFRQQTTIAHKCQIYANAKSNNCKKYQAHVTDSTRTLDKQNIMVESQILKHLIKIPDNLNQNNFSSLVKQDIFTVVYSNYL